MNGRLQIIRALTLVLAPTSTAYGDVTGTITLTNGSWASMDRYPAGTERAYVEIRDTDRDLSPTQADTLSVVFSSPRDAGESVALTELGTAGGLFWGSVALDVLGKPGNYLGDGVLQVGTADTITVTYHDPRDDFGNARSVRDKAFLAGIEGRIGDTVWQRVNSPFVVTGNLYLMNEATLQVEAGVEVRCLAGVAIIFGENANFFVLGESGNEVLFTAHGSEPWQGVVGPGMGSGRVTIRHVTFEKATVGLWISPSLVYIEHSRFRNCRDGLFSDNADGTIRHCSFEDNSANGAVIYGPLLLRMENSRLERNGNGLLIEGRLVADSLQVIDNRDSGIEVESDLTITNSAILRNGGPGIENLSYAIPPPQLTVQHCELYDNGSVRTSVDIYNDASRDVDARFNYWGPVTTAEIEAGANPKDLSRIFDVYDDASKGFVNYSHWETPTAITVQSAEAVAHFDRITVSWRLDTRAAVATVLRKCADDEWITLTTRETDSDGGITYVDNSVQPRTRYTYAISIASDSPALLGIVSASLPDAQVRVRAPAVTRSVPGMVVTVELPRRARATLDLTDTRGRRMRRWPLDHLGRGAHPITVDASYLPSGVYFLRVVHADGTDVSRTIVLK